MPEITQLEIAYRLTSACCYQPDNQWQETGLFQHLTQALKICCPSLTAHTDAMENDYRQTDLQTLLVDYAALFVGPGTLLAAPYGSVYLEKERRVMGDSTQSALDCYRAQGLVIADDFPELPDHIAVELEFCSYLLQCQVQAEQTRDIARAGNCQKQRVQFLQHHLARWIQPFCTALRNNAETTFYRQLADLIEGLVTSDLHQPIPDA